jgi:MFS family permease
MFKVISNCWALFFGMGLIMLGNGLLGSLLGVRASIEGFGLSATGLVMSGFFIGMIFGSQMVPKMVGRVGHIRMFGALASLASTAVLVHVVFIDPWAWWVMRLVTGFAYAGLYVVAESWLNDASENETRGQLLSFYMLILLGGMAGGQLLLNMAPPAGFELFVLISVLVGLAVIPILISVTQMPDFETTESVSIAQLFRVSPLGVVGMLASSVSMGTIFGLGAVYGARVGMSVREISFFMSAIILGGALIQMPLGRMSDRLGRRRIIIGVSIAGSVVAFFAPQLSGSGWQLYAVAAAMGALSTPLYSLCAAHTNDYLNPSQMVAASGTLVLVSGVGAAMGPPLAAFTMDYFDSADFFYYSIATFLAFVALYGLWRSARRDALAREDQGDFVLMAPTPISASFNPDVDLEEIEAATEIDAREVQESFEDLAEELAEELTHSSESS